jgi:prepilin-type processing-associated H-X9-DG protein
MNYQILHENGQRYGPIPAETLRQWIREGRVNAQTRAQAEGGTEWAPLANLPEFTADLFSGPPPPPGGTPGGPAKTSGLAITSLVLGILGLFTCGITSLVGLALGIVGLVRINKSEGRLSGNGLAIAGIVTSCIFVLFIPVYAAMLLPALAKAKAKAQTISCVNNLKQLELAALLYAGDHDDRLPATHWCDATATYLGTPRALVCPAHELVDCGYAFNSNLLGRSIGDVAPDTVMFFESDAGRNATGGSLLLIQQSRHGNVFNVGFADGSVRQVPESQLTSLRWNP